jgi:hypothetical protein
MRLNLESLISITDEEELTWNPQTKRHNLALRLTKTPITKTPKSVKGKKHATVTVNSLQSFFTRIRNVHYCIPL